MYSFPKQRKRNSSTAKKRLSSQLTSQVIRNRELNRGYLDIKSGDIDLRDARQEIHPGETAKFSGLNLNTDALAQIDSQGPHILMSVFSGRKSMKDNLLHCDDYAGSFESIRGRTIVIRCRLIEESFPRPGD